MEVILNFLLKNPALIYITVVVFLIGTFLFVKKVGEKYFENEMSWFIQNTIFHSYRSFLVFIYLILTILFIYLIYSFYLNFWIGIIYSVLFFYLIFRIVDSKKKGYLNLREEFEFQKYSTSIKFIKGKSINSEYRQKAYNSIIDKIARINIDNKYETKGFLLAFSEILTFDNFNYIIENNESNKTTGQLFYWKYRLSLFDTIDNLKKINDSNFLVENVLSNFTILDFDGEKGLHYNKKLALENITKTIEDTSFKKEFTALNQTVKNLIEENNDVWNLKNFRINIEINEFTNYFDSFLEMHFNEKTRRLNLKNEFKTFASIFYNTNIIKEIPQLNIDSKELQNVMRLFRFLKDTKIMEYKVTDLAKIMLNSTGLPLNERTLAQAHKITLDENEIKTLKEKLLIKNNKNI